MIQCLDVRIYLIRLCERNGEVERGGLGRKKTKEEETSKTEREGIMERCKRWREGGGG